MKRKMMIAGIGVGLVLVAGVTPEAHADTVTDAATDHSGIYATCTVLAKNFTDGEDLAKDVLTVGAVGAAIRDHYKLTDEQAGEVEILQVKAGCPQLLPELMATIGYYLSKHSSSISV